MTADLRDVAERATLDLSSEDGRTTVARRVDAFYERAAQILDKALGLDRTAEVAPGLPRALRSMAESAVGCRTAAVRERRTGRRLRWRYGGALRQDRDGGLGPRQR